MKFKVGDRVRVKESLILKFRTPGLVKILKCEGFVLRTGKNVKVKFPEHGIWYYINNTGLELAYAKNQQLLFSFMMP